jgi:hypothetical protein
LRREGLHAKQRTGGQSQHHKCLHRKTPPI